MLPGWVTGLDDYWRWAEQLFESLGGWLDEGFLSVELIAEDEADPHSRPLVLDVDRQRLHFADGSYLSFEFSIDADLSSLGYSFHYARADGTLVWRYDKHEGHEADDGVDTHVHLGAENKRLPSDEIDIGQVVEYVLLDQERDQET